MAEGFIDSASGWVKNLAASATDATTNAAKSGAEGVRSFAQDISLHEDDIVLLETNPKFQMGTEVIDGKLNPAEQNKLAQKVIQNFKTRREIDALLNNIKTTQLRSLIKSYAFPEREKGTELRPSTDKDDVSMFVDSTFGTIKSIGKGVIDSTTPWGETPNERIDNLQKEVILQAKRTRLAVHNMIKNSPEWLANPTIGFSPRHSYSGISDPFIPWNTLADRDPSTSVGQDDIIENTHEQPLESLEKIIDTLVVAARNPKNLDANLNPQNATISVPGNITSTERSFGSDYESELLFSLQFLQAMEKGANDPDIISMSWITNHPVLIGLPVVGYISYLLVRYGLIAPLKKLTPGGKIGKLFSSFIAGAELIGSEIETRTAKNKAKTAEITGEVVDDAKMETVEGVKVPKKAAELAQNALKKLRETPIGSTVFEDVELKVDGTESTTLNVDLDDSERTKRIKQIKTQLEEFQKGKITEAVLIDGISKGYNGSYIYDKAFRGVDVGNMIPTTGPARRVLHDPSIGKFKKAVKLPGAVLSGLFGGATGEAGKVGTNFAESLARKTVEKTGLGGNLAAERTAKALANADKLEPYTFEGKDWNLHNSADSKPIIKELETLLAQKERLEKAQELLAEVKDKRLILESIQAKITGKTIKPTLKTVTQVPSGVRGMPPTSVTGEAENPVYKELLSNEKEAMKELGAALRESKKTGIHADGIDINSLKVTSDSAEIDAILTAINHKFTDPATGLNSHIDGKLGDLKAKNTGSIIPSFDELKGKSMIESVGIILHSVGKIKVEPKV